MSKADAKTSTTAKETQESSSVLSKSAQGATFLILLQVGSRALTFIVNQVLLRYLSPEILGISTQLELYAISVLTFARESLRVALQRQRSDSEQEEETNDAAGGEKIPSWVATSYEPGRRAQEAVNLSYLAIGLGLPLAYILGRLYIRNADVAVLRTPYIYNSLNICAFAAFLELLSEPCFAIAQQQMLYGTRALAETFATFTRCIITCSTAIWASRTSHNLGVLPFAVGQLSYAIVLNVVYLLKVTPISHRNSFSLILRTLNDRTNNPNLFLSRFSISLLTLALNLYAQSGFKHLLTTGDSLLIAALTSLQSQGAYALASNYGGLIARILFQPIEESSRSLFARLLSPSSPPSTNPTPTKIQNDNESTDPSLTQATSYLHVLLHLYTLLSLLALSLGPTLAPLALRTIAGPRWSHTEAPLVLSTYCYYIPLLAINGILEAFVSATATPKQLREQSAWMVGFSACFALTGFLALRVGEMGARGLVVANAVNMAMRIWWSWSFVTMYMRNRGIEISVGEVTPSPALCLASAAAAWGLSNLEKGFDGSVVDLVKWAGVAGGLGVVMGGLERRFLGEGWRMLRPMAGKCREKKEM